MKFNDWLNSSPNIICMHDSMLACFEFDKHFFDDYILFRWAIVPWLRKCYDELIEIDQYIGDADFLLVDQVFYKPKIKKLLLSSGVCAVDMEVAGNDYKDGIFSVFARDGCERYLSIDFTFEKFLTRVFKAVSEKEYYEDNNKFDIKYDIAKFSLQDFEQGKGYLNVDNFDIK